MKELIDRAREGDGEAFAALIERHKQSLYKISAGFFTSEMDREDAVAQTILDGWERIGTLKKPAYFKTWLTRILINNCNDIIRSRTRLVALDAVPEPEPREDEHSGLYFQELMGLLSESVRPVMELYYGEGFKAREIAALLDVPVGTVTVRLKRGRQQLEKAILEGESEDEA